MQRARMENGTSGTTCQKTAQSASNQRDGKEWIVSPPDEVHPPLSGEIIGKFGEFLYAPSPKEIRDMLIALSRRQKWWQSLRGAVLGVTESAVVKWEAGKRKPNGAAAKLIFLLHSQIIEKADKIKNCWDLATWGQMPCRNSAA